MIKIVVVIVIGLFALSIFLPYLDIGSFITAFEGFDFVADFMEAVITLLAELLDSIHSTELLYTLLLVLCGFVMLKVLLYTLFKGEKHK